MALNEACQLWIEQEIESGLKNGDPLPALGKRIADEIRRLFEVKVKPRTVEQRARRKKAATNVTKKFKKPVNRPSPDFKPRKSTPRPTAGRKPKAKPEPEKKEYSPEVIKQQDRYWKITATLLNTVICYLNKNSEKIIYPPVMTEETEADIFIAMESVQHILK